MKNIYTYLILVLLIGWGSNSVLAQDIHFSHVHASPLLLNPAFTGVFEGDARLIANYRNQWRSVTANYRTFMASADMNLPGLNRNSVLGIGGHVYSDVAGDLDFTINNTSLSISVMQAFDEQKSHILSGGIQFGQVSNRFDPTKIVSYEQEPIYELGGTNRISYLDMAAGLLWFKKLKKTGFVYLGGSLYHLNKPEVSFYSDFSQQALYRRWVFHGGANIEMNKVLTLIPTFLFMQQGPHQQLTMGSFIRYQQITRSKNALGSVMLGGWLRGFSLEDNVGIDAFIMAIRADYADLTFTFTYDVNISSLALASIGRGGPEFSVIYTIGGPNSIKQERQQKVKKKSGIKCPVF